jgi:porin
MGRDDIDRSALTMKTKGALAAAFLLTLTGPALAQDQRPTGYPRSANERGGQPVTVSVVYTGDLRSNVAGGVRRGTRYLDNLDLQVALDADQLVGWQGARMFVYGIYNNGTSISRLVGDVQAISNIETRVRATRLFEAWIEQDVGASGSIKAGLYNLNSEFDTTQSGGLFLISSHGIGADIAQTGRNGPSIFPVTSLAVRGEVKLGEHWLGRIAVLDGVPGDPTHPKRTAIKLSAKDGALLISEVDYLRGGTKAAVGVWGYTARFDRLHPSATQGRGNKGVYAFVEQRLVGTRADDAAGSAGWLRFGIADRRYNPIGSYLGGGLVYTGLTPNRSDDQLGLSFASASFGKRYRRNRRGAGDSINDREVVIEAVYNAMIAPWLSIQPDLQYVVNPGGVRRLNDAIVVGLRFKVGR